MSEKVLDTYLNSVPPISPEGRGRYDLMLEIDQKLSELDSILASVENAKAELQESSSNLYSRLLRTWYLLDGERSYLRQALDSLMRKDEFVYCITHGVRSLVEQKRNAPKSKEEEV